MDPVFKAFTISIEPSEYETRAAQFVDHAERAMRNNESPVMVSCVCADCNEWLEAVMYANAYASADQVAGGARAREVLNAALARLKSSLSDIGSEYGVSANLKVLSRENLRDVLGKVPGLSDVLGEGNSGPGARFPNGGHW